MRGHSAPEAALTAELKRFLEARGWRAVRNESGFVPGAGSIGEKGMADWQFLRYLETPGLALVLWIEAKPPGYKPRCNCKPGEVNPKTGRRGKGHECRSCGQKRWAETERARGALVMQVNDVDAFAEWYARTFHWLPEPEAVGQQRLFG